MKLLLQISLLLSCLFASPSFHAQSFETPHSKSWEASSVEQVTTYRSFGGNAKVGGTFVTTKSGATRTDLAFFTIWNYKLFLDYNE